MGPPAAPLVDTVPLLAPDVVALAAPAAAVDDADDVALAADAVLLPAPPAPPVALAPPPVVLAPAPVALAPAAPVAALALAVLEAPAARG